MDFTGLLGRDDLNAENKHLRRSIYIGFSNSGSFFKLDTNLVNFAEKFKQHLKKNFLPHDFESDMLYSLFKEDEIPSKLQELKEDDDDDLELECVNQRPSLWDERFCDMTIAKKFKQRQREEPHHSKYLRYSHKDVKNDTRTHYYYPESSSSSTKDLGKEKKKCYSDSSSSSSSWGAECSTPPPLREEDDSDSDSTSSKKARASKLRDEEAARARERLALKVERLRSQSRTFRFFLGNRDNYLQPKPVDLDWILEFMPPIKVDLKSEDQEGGSSSRSSSPLFQPYRKTKKTKTFEDEFNELIWPQAEKKEMADKSESSSPSMNTSTSNLADLEGGDTAQVAGRDCDDFFDLEDLEVECSSRRSSPLLTLPRLFTIIPDKSKRKRSRQVKKKKMLGYLHRSVLFCKMPDKVIPFFVKQDWDSSVSERVEQARWARRRNRRRYNSSNLKLRYLNKSITFCKSLQESGEWFSSSSSSGLDLSDTERVARAQGYSMPAYASVSVLIFVNKSVCKKLAKYLGLIYIEDLLTEAKEDMFIFNGSRRNLKYCRYIQPYINKKLLSGCHNICLTHTLFLWETIHAGYKGVISETDDKELYSEAKKDTNFYVELGEAPHFFLYLEAVTLIICGILRGPYYYIARYRCEDFGENAYYPLKLSLIAFIPFYILYRIFWPIGIHKDSSNYFAMIWRRAEEEKQNNFKKSANSG